MISITKRANGSLRVQLICEDKGRTKQSAKKECDINYIVGQFQKHKKMPDMIRAVGEYLNLEATPDYREALDTVIRGQETFDMLPSRLKTRFNQDPAQFLEFVTNPKNIEEMRTLGLAERASAQEPRPAGSPATPAPASSAAAGTPQGGA